MGIESGDESNGTCPNDQGNTFYSKAVQYWSQVPPTVDGMLGGFGMISNVDISGSEKFLKLIFKLRNPPGKKTALDCGAGIGRITKYLLKNKFEVVDLVEQNPLFLEEAKKSFVECKNIGSYYSIGLQDFTPENEKYDVIWCQWVLGHLTDEDFVKFFKSCKKGLRPNGVIVVKENISGEEKEKDDLDSSVTRPMKAFTSLLHEAGLKIISNHRQRKFPSCLYEVRMLALRPDEKDIKKTTENTSENIMLPEQCEEIQNQSDSSDNEMSRKS